MTRLILGRFLPNGPAPLGGDGTVESHPGRRVYGKARHRDAVRSSHPHTAWRYGHEWVVIAVLVRCPFATRPWALPVLADLYRPPEVSRAEGRRPRAPAHLACRLLRLILLRSPGRPVVFAGGSGDGTHAAARFCRRHRTRLTLVSKCHPDANLFAPPPAYTGKGRPRVKGARQPKPRQAVAGLRPASRSRPTVPWYGGGTRRVAVATGTGHWYKGGHGWVPIRWVFVEDRTGTHRDEYLLTTDTGFSPAEAIAAYCGRWNVETTFPEGGAQLGLETPRGWCRRAVLRAAPCLLGLYSVVAGLYASLPESHQAGSVAWPGKVGTPCPDAVRSVRRWLWAAGVFPRAGIDADPAKLPPDVRELLLSGPAPAA